MTSHDGHNWYLSRLAVFLFSFTRVLFQNNINMPSRHSKRKERKRQDERRILEARKAEIRKNIRDAHKSVLRKKLKLKKLANEFCVARTSRGAKHGKFTVGRASKDLCDVRRKFDKVVGKAEATNENFLTWINCVTTAVKGGTCRLRDKVSNNVIQIRGLGRTVDNLAFGVDTRFLLE